MLFPTAPSVFISYVRFSISSWGLQLWNKILSETEKNISNLLIFKPQIKEKLLSTDIESNYISRSKKLTRSNPNITHISILLSKVLDGKV